MSIVLREVPFGGPEYHSILGLRNRVLRHPLGLVLSEKDVALDESEIHIAAFDDASVIGCVLLRPVAPGTLKLRQMAVEDAYQGKGIGADLVRFAERLGLERGFHLMETHARVSAQHFYEKLGYHAEGKPFTEVTVKTIRMTKRLLILS